MSINTAPETRLPAPAFVWWPSIVMMLGTLLSYVDRASLALLSPMFLSDIHMSAQDYSWCISAFSFAYMFAALAWGSILDRIGLRLGMAISLFIWMLSSASHALLGSFLARQGWAPKTIAGALTAVGAGLAWKGDGETIKSVGAGTMSAAGSQLALMMLDDHSAKKAAPAQVATAKKPSNADGLPPGALESAFERARERMVLHAGEQEAIG